MAVPIVGALVHALPQALIITGFVVVMMVLIEYVNVLSHGWWQTGLLRNRSGQYAAAALLGALPGCLGAYTVVSLYSHGAMTFGAVMGAMVASTGDEAFVLLALTPRTGLLLIAALFAVGWIAAVVTDRVGGAPATVPGGHALEVHEQDRCSCFEPALVLPQLRAITFSRALLLALFGLFLWALTDGSLAGDEPTWIRATLGGSVLFAVWVAATVPDHFLEEHIWEHVLKKHLLRVFAWAFGVLAAVAVLSTFMDVESWVRGNPVAVVGVAALVGLLPQSGPHLIFITLYAQGSLPLAALVANSIVQEGHGALPLLAVSRTSFVRIKAVKLAGGLLVGLLLLASA